MPTSTAFSQSSVSAPTSISLVHGSPRTTSSGLTGRIGQHSRTNGANRQAHQTPKESLDATDVREGVDSESHTESLREVGYTVTVFSPVPVILMTKRSTRHRKVTKQTFLRRFLQFAVRSK